MTADVREVILSRLEEGESLSAICRSEGMPSRRTVQRWQDAEPDFDDAVTRAREEGLLLLGDRAMAEVEACEDPTRGRLLFDARRWYLGKLSNAFSDKQRVEHSGTVGIGAALDALDDDDS